MLSRLTMGYGSWDGGHKVELEEAEKLPDIQERRRYRTLPKSASSTRVTAGSTAADGAAQLPRTFLTRSGALVLYSSDKDPPEHKLDILHGSSGAGTSDVTSRLGGQMQRMAKSVLVFGDEDGRKDDRSISDPHNKVFLKFLHYLDSSGGDTCSAPGRNVDRYLRELTFRTGSSKDNHASLRNNSSRGKMRLFADAEHFLEDLSHNDVTDDPDRLSARQWRVLSADKLAASLRSTSSYLGRPSPPPQPPRVAKVPMDPTGGQGLFRSRTYHGGFTLPELPGDDVTEEDDLALHTSPSMPLVQPSPSSTYQKELQRQPQYAPSVNVPVDVSTPVDLLRAGSNDFNVAVDTTPLITNSHNNSNNRANKQLEAGFRDGTGIECDNVQDDYSTNVLLNERNNIVQNGLGNRESINSRNSCKELKKAKLILSEVELKTAENNAKESAEDAFESNILTQSICENTDVESLSRSPKVSTRCSSSYASEAEALPENEPLASTKPLSAPYSGLLSANNAGDEFLLDDSFNVTNADDDDDVEFEDISNEEEVFDDELGGENCRVETTEKYSPRNLHVDLPISNIDVEKSPNENSSPNTETEYKVKVNPATSSTPQSPALISTADAHACSSSSIENTLVDLQKQIEHHVDDDRGQVADDVRSDKVVPESSDAPTDQADEITISTPTVTVSRTTLRSSHQLNDSGYESRVTSYSDVTAGGSRPTPALDMQREKTILSPVTVTEKSAGSTHEKVDDDTIVETENESRVVESVKESNAIANNEVDLVNEMIPTEYSDDAPFNEQSTSRNDTREVEEEMNEINSGLNSNLPDPSQNNDTSKDIIPDAEDQPPTEKEAAEKVESGADSPDILITSKEQESVNVQESQKSTKADDLSNRPSSSKLIRNDSSALLKDFNASALSPKSFSSNDDVTHAALPALVNDDQSEVNIVYRNPMEVNKMMTPAIKPEPPKEPVHRASQPPARFHRKQSVVKPNKEELEMQQLEKEVGAILENKDDESDDDELTPEELELRKRMLEEKMHLVEDKLRNAEKKKAPKRPAKVAVKKGKIGKKKEKVDAAADLAAQKAAIKEQKRLEKERRLKEAAELQTKIKQGHEDRERELKEMEIKKREMEEDKRRLAEEAEMAARDEEMARAAVEDARKAARRERDERRKLEAERKKEEARQRREAQRQMKEAARKRELDMLEKLGEMDKVRQIREEEARKREMEEDEEQARQEAEEQEEKKRHEEEEERQAEIDRQVEEEALARLVAEREEAEKRQWALNAEARRLEEEEHQKQKKLQEEAEKLELEKQQKEEEEKLRLEAEQMRREELQRMEDLARAQLRDEMERRREAALRRREQNLERREHLSHVTHGQRMTKPWVFSYYVLWNRQEKLVNKPEKKKGFKPKKKK